jgi:hypothetical protein
VLPVLVLPSSPFPASTFPPDDDPLPSPVLPLLEPDADPLPLPLGLVLPDDEAPVELVPDCATLVDPDDPEPLEAPLEPTSEPFGELAHPAARATQKSTRYFIGSYLFGKGVDALAGCSLGRRAPEGARDPELAYGFSLASGRTR